MKPWVKFILSLGIWTLALVMAIVGNWTLERSLILLAVTCAFFGDVSMIKRQLAYSSYKKKYFTRSLIAFGIMHCLYVVVAIIRIVKDVGSIEQLLLGMGISFVLYFVIASIFYYKMTYLIPFGYETALELYMIVMACSVMALYIYSFNCGKFFAALGITLFLISDSLIAVREFMKVNTKKIHVWIWITYVIGQTMIIFG